MPKKSKPSPEETPTTNSTTPFDLQSETLLFDCLSSIIPISYYKPFSMLNTHVVLKREANVVLPIEEIEKHVGTFYDLKVLEQAKEVQPLIQSRKIEYFKLPADIMEQFGEEGKKGSTSSTQKKKKKK